MLGLEYSNNNHKAEKYCEPFVIKWLTDTIGDKYKYKIIPIPNYSTDPKLKDDVNNNIYEGLQSSHVDVWVNFYGRRKPRFIDFKGTYGVKWSGEKFEGYGILTMEMYWRLKSNPKEVHKSYAFIGNFGLEKDCLELLYASKEMMILIPKDKLAKVMQNPKYKWKFDVTNVEWVDNESDGTKQKQSKNIKFNLQNENDLEILDAAGTSLYLRLKNGTYKEYDILYAEEYVKRVKDKFEEMQNNRQNHTRNMDCPK